MSDDDPARLYHFCVILFFSWKDQDCLATGKCICLDIDFQSDTKFQPHEIKDLEEVAWTCVFVRVIKVADYVRVWRWVKLPGLLDYIFSLSERHGIWLGLARGRINSTWYLNIFNIKWTEKNILLLLDKFTS